jgi:hypothetical protein
VSRQRWSDLSPQAQQRIVAAGVVQIALWLAAVLDLRRRPAEDVNGPKAMWFGLSFVNFAGPLAYFAFGRRRQ